MRVLLLIFSSAALGLAVGVGAIYIHYEPRAVAQVDGAYLSSFGGYFGGVAGPLLTLLTIFGVSVALAMQNRQIEQVSENVLRDQHARMLLEIDRGLEAIERDHISPDITLGQVLSGARSLQHAERDRFGMLLRRYLKLLGQYAVGVELYRENVTEYFDCKAFEQRGLWLLDRVEPYFAQLEGSVPITAAIIRGHLEDTLVKR